jgi:hypothetical protein
MPASCVEMRQFIKFFKSLYTLTGLFVMRENAFKAGCFTGSGYHHTVSGHNLTDVQAILFTYRAARLCSNEKYQM